MQRPLWLAALAAAAALAQVDVPANCTAACAASQKLIDACSPVTVQCSCTEPYERGLYDCGVCVGNGNATDYALQQVQLDAFVDACQSRGVTLPRLSYPGQGTSSSESSSSASTSTSTEKSPAPTTSEGSQPSTTDTPPNSATRAGQSPARAWMIVLPIALLAVW